PAIQRLDDLLAEEFDILDRRDELAQHQLDAQIAEPPKLIKHLSGRPDAARPGRWQRALLAVSRVRVGVVSLDLGQRRGKGRLLSLAQSDKRIDREADLASSRIPP